MRPYILAQNNITMNNNASKTRHLWIAAILIIAAISIIISVKKSDFTIILHEGTSCKIKDPTFSLSWVHSVDKTPWIEQYQRSNHGFILTHSIFRTFGAGVPHDGKVLESHDGMIHYEMNQPIAEINWVIDREVQSTIILPQQHSWKIYENSPRFSEVQIRNQPLNFWQRLLIRNCHETQ